MPKNYNNNITGTEPAGKKVGGMTHQRMSIVGLGGEADARCNEVGWRIAVVA